MLLPRDYKPDKNSFFYEEPNTGCENEENDGRAKRQRTEQDSDEEVNESTGAILRDEDTEGDNEDNEKADHNAVANKLSKTIL